MMQSNPFESMSIGELWTLHEEVNSILARKIAEEKAKLDEQLRLLNVYNAITPDSPRRPYPKVLPKYQNPENPGETWSGRGKQPHWVRAQLKAGKKLEHFLVVRRRSDRPNR